MLPIFLKGCWNAAIGSEAKKPYPKMNIFFFTCVSPQLPSEYEANPELLFYRITHLNHRQQYLIWAAAVTTAGRGNFSDKVTVEPAAKGKAPIMIGQEHF